jgi:hypothetical protein
MHHDKSEHNYRRKDYRDHDRTLKMVHHWHCPMAMKVNRLLLNLTNEIVKHVICSFHFHCPMKIVRSRLYVRHYPMVSNQCEV